MPRSILSAVLSCSSNSATTRCRVSVLQNCVQSRSYRVSLHQQNTMLQRQRPFSGSNVGKRWHSKSSRLGTAAAPRAVKTPYPETTRKLNTDAPTDVLYDAVIVGGEVVRQPLTEGGGQDQTHSPD